MPKIIEEIDISLKITRKEVLHMFLALLFQNYIFSHLTLRFTF